MEANSTTFAPVTQTDFTPCIVDSQYFETALRTIIILTSSLSILGALLIILVLYCKKDRLTADHTSSVVSEEHTAEEENNRASDRVQDIRGTVQHPARVILVCISAANIIAAVSHIWGVTSNYDRLQQTSLEHLRGINVSAESTECGAQAVVAIFGTLSSFLWSDVLAFMAVLMLKSSKKLKPSYFVTNRMFVFYNIVCWGVPLLVLVILGVYQGIGYEQGVDVGWCYIKSWYHKKSERVWWLMFSYELWVCSSMLWILVMVLLFCVIHYAKSVQNRRRGEGQALIPQSSGEGEEADTQNYAYCGCSKPLIMITAAASLILFRIWDTYLDFQLVPSISERKRFHCTLANPIIVAFAGFGNCCQGLVNFLLFIVFTGECCKIICSQCNKQRHT